MRPNQQRIPLNSNGQPSNPNENLVLGGRSMHAIERELTDFISSPVERGKVDEVLFVKRFLPLFIQKDRSKIDIQYWGEMYGFYQWVDVVNAQGQIVCSVPPCLSTDALTIKKMQNTSFTFNDVLNYVQVQAAYGRVSAKKAFDEVLKPMLNVKIHHEYKQAWNKIFDRYKVPLHYQLEGEEIKPALSSPIVNQKKDDVDYELF